MSTGPYNETLKMYVLRLFLWLGMIYTQISEFLSVKFFLYVAIYLYEVIGQLPAKLPAVLWIPEILS